MSMFFALQLLLSAAADPALFLAAKNGNASQIRKLIDKGGDINQRNPFGMTLLHTAAYWDQSAAIPLLVSLGADLTVRTIKPWSDGQNNYKPGLTALDLAKLRGKKKTVETLQRALNQAACTAKPGAAQQWNEAGADAAAQDPNSPMCAELRGSPAPLREDPNHA